MVITILGIRISLINITSSTFYLFFIHSKIAFCTICHHFLIQKQFTTLLSLCYNFLLSQVRSLLQFLTSQSAPSVADFLLNHDASRIPGNNTTSAISSTTVCVADLNIFFLIQINKQNFTLHITTFPHIQKHETTQIADSNSSALDSRKHATLQFQISHTQKPMVRNTSQT